MRTKQRREADGRDSSLAALMALQRENPKLARRRFNALTTEELRDLSLEVSLYLWASAVEMARVRA